MADLPRTRRKPDEAKFFLWQMETWIGQSTEQGAREWRVFGYYLSAFINAGRGVTFVLHKEDKPLYKRKWLEWDARLSSEEKKFLQFMVDLRDTEVKKTGIELQQAAQTIPITETASWASMPAHLKMEMTQAAAQNLAGAGFFPSDITIEDLIPRIGAILPQFPGGGDVIPACRRYVELLEQFVQDCERSPDDPLLPDG
jgi:hypothetical protein